MMVWLGGCSGLEVNANYDKPECLFVKSKTTVHVKSRESGIAVISESSADLDVMS
jgi:hypothetical protein